jgi:hypothetical protein
MSDCTRPLIFIGKKMRMRRFSAFFQLVPNCEFDQKKRKDLSYIFSQVNVVLYQQNDQKVFNFNCFLIG